MTEHEILTVRKDVFSDGENADLDTDSIRIS